MTVSIPSSRQSSKQCLSRQELGHPLGLFLFSPWLAVSLAPVRYLDVSHKGSGADDRACDGVQVEFMTDMETVLEWTRKWGALLARK